MEIISTGCQLKRQAASVRCCVPADVHLGCASSRRDDSLRCSSQVLSSSALHERCTRVSFQFAAAPHAHAARGRYALQVEKEKTNKQPHWAVSPARDVTSVITAGDLSDGLANTGRRLRPPAPRQHIIQRFAAARSAVRLPWLPCVTAFQAARPSALSRVASRGRWTRRRVLSAFPQPLRHPCCFSPSAVFPCLCLHT